MSLGNLQLKAAASHSTMYPGNKRKKLWREEKGTDLLHLKSAAGAPGGEREGAGRSPNAASPTHVSFREACRKKKKRLPLFLLLLSARVGGGLCPALT